jgi:hypothetical protein
MSSFRVEPLLADWVDRAFALVQLCEPDLGLEQWRCYARMQVLSDGSSGIRAITGSDGYLYGLFSFACGTDLYYGRVLRIDLCVLPTLISSDGLQKLVFDAIQQIADRLSCRTVGIRPTRAMTRADPKIAAPDFRRDCQARQTQRMWFDLPLSGTMAFELFQAAM